MLFNRITTTSNAKIIKGIFSIFQIYNADAIFAHF